MEVKFDHWIPKFLDKSSRKVVNRTVNAITLLGTAYFRDSKSEVDNRLYTHEKKHARQQEEYGLMFYIIYLYEYFKRLIKTHSHSEAYLNIPYEVEARRAENG
jgi:hypothetical protein